MSILAWNVRGLGNQGTVRALRNSVAKHKPYIVFLSKTKQKRRYLEKIKMKMKFSSSFYVDPKGIAGGLAIWWNEEVSISVLEYTTNFIDTRVVSQNGDNWFGTFIYGPPYRDEKQPFWEKLANLRENNKSKWLIIGDSNVVLRQEEKTGGKPVNLEEAKHVYELMNSKGLIELPIKGGNYTWFNQRGGVNSILEKLDCIICSAEWSLSFPKALGIMEIAVASDHAPLILLTKGLTRKYKKDFKFESKWLLEETCSQTVTEGWRTSPGEKVTSRFGRKIRNTRSSLIKWSKDNQRRRNEKKQRLEDAIKKLQGRRLSDAELEQFKTLRKELDAEWEGEERYWHQRSRISWLKWGDKNTKFFHATTIQRRRTNAIIKLKGEDGSWIEEPDHIALHLQNHFQKVFKKDHSVDFQSLHEYIPKMITEEMNQELTKEITPEEVKKAVFAMGATKAPGPDGFPGCFYQSFWETVKDDLIEMVLAFFRGGELGAGLNKTNIVLIPKISNPTEVSHFRPISLCNFSFKVITKILSTRLKAILPDIIPPLSQPLCMAAQSMIMLSLPMKLSMP
ncbi:hypothetical protein HRI_004677700 [Hibiscus trionum]|uniref:Endonuclease/exonuclease/phosphatase domain-containing protein n=1 Tax=Hibiscus trionum TaxID=183268 RepID=A0A9W7J8Q3_HIBTR|nr:hypothetical protein HRI_004677700 [Hibiscus trionum]